MLELQVGLAERSYPIYINSGGLAGIGADLKQKKIAQRYAVIADNRVVELYGKVLENSFETVGLEAVLFTFPAGEQHKTLQTIEKLASQLVLAGFDRTDAVVGFGGGVSGDLAGFLAASYMRGVPFVQIPTTLLAQVDSSVGGKTGVDLPQGKNLLGAFYQPKAVYIDIAVLKTLSKQQFLGGLAEVIKYGVIRDSDFFSFLKDSRKKIFALDKDTLIRMISRCCEIKAEVVAADEREGGLRRILNFGHTVGHAVEAASDYSLIHGLAVSIGMAAAARLSFLSGFLSLQEKDKIVALLSEFGLPLNIPVELDRKQIRQYLLADKKSIGGKICYVLPTSIGSTLITDNISSEHLDEVLDEFSLFP